MNSFKKSKANNGRTIYSIKSTLLKRIPKAHRLRKNAVWARPRLNNQIKLCLLYDSCNLWMVRGATVTYKAQQYVKFSLLIPQKKVTHCNILYKLCCRVRLIYSQQNHNLHRVKFFLLLHQKNICTRETTTGNTSASAVRRVYGFSHPQVA